ncbi:immunoglobulin-like domain-containing protein [Bacillus cereus]
MRRQVNTQGGTFAVYAKDIVTDPTQKVEIVGFDSNNQEVVRETVQVK